MSSTNKNPSGGEGEGEGEGPWDLKTSQKFNSKLPGEYFDPCQEAASRSLKCLARNSGDRELCTDYFQAYRDCKLQWQTARKEAKAAKRAERGGWFS